MKLSKRDREILRCLSMDMLAFPKESVGGTIHNVIKADVYNLVRKILDDPEE